MTLTYGLIWGSWVLFGALTTWGLVWALRRGQLERPREAARSIFDAGEPVGRVTDRFPEPQGER